MQTLKEVTDFIDRQNKLQNMEEEIKNLRQQNAELLEVLRSIAANTCCDGCQEAALVARAAIAKATGGE